MKKLKEGLPVRDRFGERIGSLVGRNKEGLVVALESGPMEIVPDDLIFRAGPDEVRLSISNEERALLEELHLPLGERGLEEAMVLPVLGMITDATTAVHPAAEIRLTHHAHALELEFVPNVRPFHEREALRRRPRTEGPDHVVTHHLETTLPHPEEDDSRLTLRLRRRDEAVETERQEGWDEVRQPYE